MRALMVCVLSACVLAAGVSGCKPGQSREERKAAAAEALSQEVETRLAEVLDLQANGQGDAALVLLEKCLANKRYKVYRPRLFAQQIDLLLVQNMPKVASGLILKTWKKEPQIAQSVFTRIHTYHQDKRDNAAVLAWCKQLLGMGKGETLPQHLRPQVLEWLLAAATALDDTDAITDAVVQIVLNLPPAKAVPLLQQTVNAMISSGKFQQVSAILSLLASDTAQEYKALTATANLKSLIAQKDWPKVPGAFEVCAVQLKDADLSPLLRQMFSVLQKNNQVALLEKSCQGIFMTAPDKAMSAGYAARVWVDIGMAMDKRVLQERLVTLLDAKVLPEHVAMLFERYFYEFAKDYDTIKSLCVLGGRIMSMCNDEEARNLLKVKLLDGAFIVEDYGLALQMLESGIPGQSKEWHDMSIPKVKAHYALVQNKTQEAIVHFRAFMTVMAGSETGEEHDPTTGIAYSKEWILARNAHRIATLYDSLSDTANAAKAREEAKAFFAAARAKVENDADTLSVLEKEMKEMGF